MCPEVETSILTNLAQAKACDVNKTTLLMGRKAHWLFGDRCVQEVHRTIIVIMIGQWSGHMTIHLLPGLYLDVDTTIT